MADIYGKVAICCSECGCSFSVPEALYNGLKETHSTFYCPGGHSQWFPSSKVKIEDTSHLEKAALEEQLKVAQYSLDIAKRRLKRANKTYRCCVAGCKHVSGHKAGLTSHLEKAHGFSRQVKRLPANAGPDAKHSVVN